MATQPTGSVVGLRLPGILPLALESASQFRPDGPSPLTSEEFAEDFNQVKQLGRLDSATRTPAQTAQALFWTDHDLRQWNDGMLNLAVGRGLDLVQTARMLAMAHVSGGDAMIAGFEAKYHYWFWRPYQAIPLAATDGNAATTPDPTWQPLRSTPNQGGLEPRTRRWSVHRRAPLPASPMTLSDAGPHVAAPHRR